MSPAIVRTLKCVYKTALNRARDTEGTRTTYRILVGENSRKCFHGNTEEIQGYMETDLGENVCEEVIEGSSGSCPVTGKVINGGWFGNSLILHTELSVL
jgi:hypothetical protein